MAGKKVIYDLLGELRAQAAQAIGSENGTAIDVGSGGTTLVRGICTITANAGTLTLKLQGSSDNSTFYDIPGSNFLDPADGAVMDGTGQFEVYIQTDFQYVRHVGVVAGGAVTYGVFLTKSAL